MKKTIKFLRDEEGATAIEYGIMAALIGGVIILTVKGLGQTLDGVFSGIDEAISGLPGGTSTN